MEQIKTAVIGADIYMVLFIDNGVWTLQNVITGQTVRTHGYGSKIITE